MSTARNVVTSPKFGILALVLIAVAVVAMALVTTGRASANHTVTLGGNGLNITGKSTCEVIGTWDATTSPPTCTVTHDVFGIIGIKISLTLDGDGHSFTGTAYQTIDVQAPNVTVKNTIIFAPAGGGGLAGNNWKNVKILDNVISNQPGKAMSVGIGFTGGSTGNIISGNRIELLGPPGYGIAASYLNAVTITDNTIISSYAGILLGGIKILPHIFCPTNPTYCSENHVVTGNTITLIPPPLGPKPIAAVWIQQSDGSTICRRSAIMGHI